MICAHAHGEILVASILFSEILFLDGTLQSTLYGEAEYHEALVHPPMISHPNPKRVAIIGGGEGATLREVLKHKTVEEVLMVELDGELVEMCKDHLWEWSDCSDILGSDADSCFDDSRSNVVFEDAFKYFIDRFEKVDNDVKKFDVIIMVSVQKLNISLSTVVLHLLRISFVHIYQDALDPEKFVEIAGSLYKDNVFVDSLFNGLSDEGVVS